MESFTIVKESSVETDTHHNPMSAHMGCIQTLIAENRRRALKSPPKTRVPSAGEPFIFVGTPKTYILHNICSQCGQNKNWCLCHVDQELS